MPYPASPVLRLQAVIAAQRDITACGLELQRVMDVTTARARELTSADAAVLELREGSEMVYRSGSGVPAHSIGMRLGVHESLSGRSVLERSILISHDTEDDPRVNREACRKVGARSMVCVPLFEKDEAVGVLKVYANQPHCFDEGDRSTLELMAGLISMATANAVAQRALATSERRFRVLVELASDGIITADVRGRIRSWNKSATQMFGYSEAEILGQPISRLMPARFVHGLGGALDNLASGPISSLIGNRLEMSGLRRDGSEFPVELSTSTWPGEGEQFYTAIVRDMSARKQLEDTVLAMARTDHLTGLLNRRAGDEALQRESVRARRHQHALSVVLLDIDRFKSINDGAGHAGGDQVLKRVAELIKQRVRRSDFAIRWGGEEFLIVLPETEREGAVEAAEALRQQVAATAFEVVPSVTLSCGVATLAEDETPEQVLGRADTRLYAAKNSGRNCVES